MQRPLLIAAAAVLTGILAWLPWSSGPLPDGQGPGLPPGPSEQAGLPLGYMVNHPSFTYVVDPRGRLGIRLAHGIPPEAIVAATRAILVAC